MRSAPAPNRRTPGIEGTAVPSKAPHDTSGKAGRQACFPGTAAKKDPAPQARHAGEADKQDIPPRYRDADNELQTEPI